MLDAVLLGAVQKLQHYCIAAWGTTASLGRLLDEPAVVSLMERILEEGKRDDKALTELAESEVNPAMITDDDGEAAAEVDEEEDAPAKSKGKAANKKK